MTRQRNVTPVEEIDAAVEKVMQEEMAAEEAKYVTIAGLHIIVGEKTLTIGNPDAAPVLVLGPGAALDLSIALRKLAVE